ncbi:hypothetical protein V8G54_027820 [Vigna mungo]|uniref:Uncharacterized protein n=1 Tax=Vigna mungo TaxID=3915 RepID=A0AAQ3MS93_VIGMU
MPSFLFVSTGTNCWNKTKKGPIHHTSRVNVFHSTKNATTQKLLNFSHLAGFTENECLLFLDSCTFSIHKLRCSATRESEVKPHNIFREEEYYRDEKRATMKERNRELLCERFIQREYVIVGVSEN